MENKKYSIIIIILLILVIGFQQYRLSNIKTDTGLLNKIENLENKIDNLSNQRDSIRVVIDSTHVKIVTNEKHYQEMVNTIIIQPDSVSESFTRQYLSDYAAARGYRITRTPETND